jgi:hypothetical protein
MDRYWHGKAVVKFPSLCWVMPSPSFCLALQVLLVFGHLLYLSLAFDQLGAFVRMVQKVIYELRWFFVFFITVWVAFASALRVLQKKEYCQEANELWKPLFALVIGDSMLSFISDKQYIAYNSHAFGYSQVERKQRKLGGCGMLCACVDLQCTVSSVVVILIVSIAVLGGGVFC